MIDYNPESTSGYMFKYLLSAFIPLGWWLTATLFFKVGKVFIFFVKVDFGKCAYHCEVSLGIQ